MLEIIDAGDLKGNYKKFTNLLNKKAGPGNWWWIFKSKYLYSFNWGMNHYEDAYYSFLKKRPDLLSPIIESKEIIFDHEKDLISETNYSIQKSYKEHYADIALRRIMIRLGVQLPGKGYYSIKNEELDPSNVPFHLPHLVNNRRITASDWISQYRKVVIADSIDSQFELSKYLIS